MCAWLQIAPCDPPPDEERDHALIAQYLDPRTFLLWLRSMLGDEPATPPVVTGTRKCLTATAEANDSRVADIGVMPTVEEILRSWARDSSALSPPMKR